MSHLGFSWFYILSKPSHFWGQKSSLYWPLVWTCSLFLTQALLQWSSCFSDVFSRAWSCMKPSEKQRIQEPERVLHLVCEDQQVWSKARTAGILQGHALNEDVYLLCKHDNDAFLSEKGSFLLRNARTAREAFFIQVYWAVQLLLLSLALFTALGDLCWNTVKSLTLHLYPWEHNGGADVVSTTSAGPSSLHSGTGCLHSSQSWE